MHHIEGHGGVDLAGQLDKAGILAKLARLPSQIEGINGNAVTAQARPRIERHETERLGLGRVDDLPDINAHGAIDDLELVDEGDVHPTEGVLEQFRCLRCAAG